MCLRRAHVNRGLIYTPFKLYIQTIIKIQIFSGHVKGTFCNYFLFVWKIYSGSVICRFSSYQYVECMYETACIYNVNFIIEWPIELFSLPWRFTSKCNYLHYALIFFIPNRCYIYLERINFQPNCQYQYMFSDIWEKNIEVNLINVEKMILKGFIYIYNKTCTIKTKCSIAGR